VRLSDITSANLQLFRRAETLPARRMLFPREVAHCGIEQGGISRIDPPGQVQNDMAVAKLLKVDFVTERVFKPVMIGEVFQPHRFNADYDAGNRLAFRGEQ